MALRWYHPFISTKTDGIDSTLVKPSDWNKDHTASTDTTSGIVVGRDNQASGNLQELPASWDPVKKVWSFLEAVGGLFPGAGTTAQRPATPAAGTIRFNTQSGQHEFFARGAWRNFGEMGSSFGAILGGELTVGPSGSSNLSSYQEYYDYDGSFDAPNGVWNPQVAGYYLVSAHANMSVDGGGAMRLTISLVGNVAAQGDIYSQPSVENAACSNVFHMAVGQWCRLQVINFAPASGARIYGGPHTGFSAVYVGP